MVTERRREIGIRMALGANRSRVLAQVMKHGLLLTTIGVAVGLAGALGLNRLMASLLFGVRPTDAGTLRCRDPDRLAGGGGRLLAAGMARVAAGPERRAQGGLAIAD